MLLHVGRCGRFMGHINKLMPLMEYQARFFARCPVVPPVVQLESLAKGPEQFMGSK
jgi:hypothetical protein